MRLGTLLREHRGRLGLTQEELARRASMSVRALRAIETGRVRHPRPHTVRQVADALGLDAAARARLHATASGAGCDEPPGAPQPGAGESRPAQLPLDPAHFTGREPELAWLDELVDPDAGPRATVGVLSGVAGVGKTALAVHWAHRVRDRFPDGQLYLDVKGHSGGAPITAGEALGRFLRAVGVPAEEVPYDVDEAAAMYRTLLADRRMLIVLDNVVDPDEVRPLLPGGTGCRVVVTSRDRLSTLVTREGGRPLTLRALGADESLAILRGPAGTRLDADPAAAARLASLCRGLPLALRVAAARLGAEPDLPLDGFVTELLAVLRGERSTDADERAAAVAMFDLSYRQLPGPARALFRRLGLLPGADATVEVAAVLAGVTTGAAGVLLDRLVAAHLVQQPAPGRFALHDLAREHARHLADASDDHAAVARSAWWYLGTADNAARAMYPHLVRAPLPAPPDDVAPTALDDAATAVAWFDAERTNLVAVALAAPAGAPPVWAFADTLRGYFWLRHHVSDWLAVAGAAVSAAAVAGEPRAEASSRVNLGHALYSAERFVDAVRETEHAADLAADAGWPEGRAAALGNAGAMHMEVGRLDRAVDRFADAIKINQEIGQLVGWSVNLHNLGSLYRNLGRLPEAEAVFRETLAVNRQVGSAANEGRAVLGLGCLARDRGRLTEALDLLLRALHLVREVGDRVCEVYVLETLAGTHRDLGDLDAAVAACEEALAVHTDGGGDVALAHLLTTRASVDLARGDPAAAVAACDRVLDLLSPDRHPVLRVTAMLWRAFARVPARPSAAADDAGRALTISSALGLEVLRGQAHLALAAIAAAAGDRAATVDSARAALEIHERCDHLMGRVHALVLLEDADTARALLVDAGATRPDVVLRALGPSGS